MLRNIENEALDKLKKYNQEEIIDILNILSEQEKNNLYKQIINIDFKQIDDLYNELTKKEKITGNDIQEVKAINKDRLSKIELENYDKKRKANYKRR